MTAIDEALAAATLLLILWLLMSGATALLHAGLHDWLHRTAPQARRRLLSVLAILPLATSSVTTALIFLPLDIPEFEHCHDALGCQAHIPSWLASGTDDRIFAFAICALITTIVFRVLRLLQAHRLWAATLRGLAIRPDARGFWILDCERPLALCAGLWSSRIFVSSGLLRALGDDELRTIVAHESCHARRRDNLVHLLAMTLFCPLTRLPGRHLMGDLFRSAEHVADQAAARHSTPERVARTLLRVQRLGLQSHDPSLSQINSTAFEQRIAELLSAHNAASAPLMGTTLGFAVAAGLIGIGLGHHLMEVILTWMH
ncbi:MAG: M56 family metallopeptidase [Nevskiales bacterium]|nr:M56 family metallopeptidase [Nevskiales bacterium]